MTEVEHRIISQLVGTEFDAALLLQSAGDSVLELIEGKWTSGLNRERRLHGLNQAQRQYATALCLQAHYQIPVHLTYVGANRDEVRAQLTKASSYNHPRLNVLRARLCNAYRQGALPIRIKTWAGLIACIEEQPTLADMAAHVRTLIDA